MKVKDVMTADVVTADPAMTLKDAARLLALHRISGLPVVDADGGVVGVLSETDILFKERGPTPDGGRRLSLFTGLRADGRAKSEAQTVGEAMTSPPQTIAPWRPVSAAAARMLEAKVNRLPVVQNRSLVGIVTRSDLVRAFVRADAEIEREIRDDIRRVLLIAPETLAIAVDEGKVALAGRVDRRVDATTVAELAGRVPGVVSVVSTVTSRD